MKLITLNLWGGNVYDPLIAFLEQYKDSIDIFCFQEMLFAKSVHKNSHATFRSNLFEEISKVLSDFNTAVYYAPKDALYFQADELPEGAKAGQAIFIKQSIPIHSNGGFRTYKNGYPPGTHLGGKITGSCQWITIMHHDQPLTILNLHGLWQKDTSKKDTAQRYTQSKIVQQFIKKTNNTTIVCGDFNLDPNGKSLEMLEEGLVNLIRKFNIPSTRSVLYLKPEKHADYILTSQDIQVNHFEALSVEVSDHLPLVLEFL